ncbi:hypothetical protein CPAL_22780 [Clostridium thermopalmarium DSM 5974]|uniref:Uncharacterized protein n=1 Tax=Clostridium thermopalmarium DSM 5974 TaxID=1121340 RepID=A0A2T0AN67_9CLOT|nr:hypothetical protein CPAL_22780 [Clostridium thermopalmarium DSM 5974]PVZ20861.1 hypothetical protein LX19_02589 [Clostridium thermopalmarium DSM 5974]
MIEIAIVLAKVITSESVKALGFGYALGIMGGTIAKCNSK